MTDIRPMDFGEILDGSVAIYRRHFGLFLQLAMITLAVPVVFLVYLGARFLGSVVAQAPNLQAVLLLVPVAILYYFASLVLTAGTIRIISDSYLGRPPSLRDALALGLSRLWALVGVGLGKGLLLTLVIFGVVLVTALLTVLSKGNAALSALVVFAGVVGGCWFAVFVLCGYGVTTPVVALEHLASSFDAFRRSWELTKNFKLRILGLGLIAILLTNTLPSVVFRLLGAALLPALPPVGMALTALSYIVPLILTPLLAAVITLMYYDLRVRREAFDLQVLGEQLGIV
jgi:hypothetical protein